jgi:heme/copper-type cytochrome/quinol oxidase subunit 3
VRNAIDNNKGLERHLIAWLVGGLMVLAFVAGIVVDVDHPLAKILGIPYARFLHPYFALAGFGFLGLGIILAIACLCRYLQLRILRKRSY